MLPMMAPAMMSHQSVYSVSVEHDLLILAGISGAARTVIFVDRQSTSDENCAKDGHVEKNELVEMGPIVREDFEFGVEVEIEKDCFYQLKSLQLSRYRETHQIQRKQP